MATHARGASAPVLKFHPRKKVPHHQLPFIGKDHHPESSYWDVPARGGYLGGNIAGDHLGRIFLHHLRSHGNAPLAHLYLQWIVSAWMDQAVSYSGGEIKPIPEQSEALISLRGQIAGFMSTLSPWLMAAVEQLGQNLERVAPAAELAAANRGLSDEGRCRFEETISHAA